MPAARRSALPWCSCNRAMSDAQCRDGPHGAGVARMLIQMRSDASSLPLYSAPNGWSSRAQYSRCRASDFCGDAALEAHDSAVGVDRLLRTVVAS